MGLKHNASIIEILINDACINIPNKVRLSMAGYVGQ